MSYEKKNILRKIISLSLILYCFTQVYSIDSNTIQLLETESSHEKVLKNIESEVFHIDGALSKNGKFLLISSINEISENNSSQSKSPLLFISKNQNDLSYDYTSIIQSTKFGNKIVLPYSYLDKNGFYLNITCENICEKNNLKFESLDEINLEIGEKFSFLSKEEEINTFIINMNLTNYNISDIVDNIVFIVSGGEPKQLSMIVNKNIKAKKAFGDVYFASMSSSQIHYFKFMDKELKIEIKVGKNVKFNFESLIILKNEYFERDENYLIEGEYNQYLALKGNRKECFNVQILNEDKEKSYNIPREISIIGKNEFQANIFCDLIGETNKMDFGKNNEFDDYVVSDGLNCQSSVKKICITTSSEDIEIIQIHIHKRINENSTKIVRKMNEPLLNEITYKFILNEENTSDNSNDHINFHSHSQFYEKDENNKDIIGLNVGIQVLYGIIKVYRDICETYPYCSLSKEKLNNLIENENIDSTFETINGEGGFYSTSFFSFDDTYSMSTKQNIIIILCKNANFGGCSYQITYYNMQSYKKLYSGSIITKYLPFYNLDNLYPKDNYELFLHRNKKLVLDLVVYSGEAYLTPLTNKDGCTYEEHHLGSNERRIITCSENNDENDEKNGYTRILFDVKANKKAAFYSIYVLEKEENDLEDSWPMEMTIMESIHETKRIVKVLGKYLNDPPKKANSNFVAIFNSLNCDLNVRNLNTSYKYSSEYNDDIIQDSTRASKRIDLFYEIEKKSDFHKENKNCLYFISSFDINNEDSSFIIPEAKPFRFKLNWETNILRVNFPYAVNDDGKNKNVFLRVNLLNNIPIKIIIKIGFLPYEEHILYYSKNINIITNKINLKKNRFTKIRISIETFDIYDEAIIDFTIRTNSPIPYSIKTEKYFSDLTLTNNIQYYMALIKQNSEGEILVNFKRSNGQIFAKLIREDKLREVSGWGDRFIIPNNDIDKRLLLHFDPFTQKVFFTKSETNNCDKYCYLIFGVDANDNLNLKIDSKDNVDEDAYFVPYNLYFKYSDENENDIKFVDLQNNEYISNYLNNGDDYYQYHIFDFFNNENINKVIIDFISESCELIIGFNTDDFSDTRHILNFSDKTVSNERIELNKDEISKYYVYEEEIDYYSTSDDLFLYFKIMKKGHLNNLLDINELDLLYTLRANSPSYFAENVNIINNIQPNNCDFTEEKNYCDYLMKLESLNSQIIIELFALSNNLKNIYILANAISSDDFGKYIQNNKLPEWPNLDNKGYHFPEGQNKKDNYLSINYNQIESKIKNLLDPLLLIRIYGEKNSNAKLLSSMHNNNNINENYVNPLINREQIYSVEDKKSLLINLPNDDDYICKIIPRKGTGNITYHDKKYILDGNYEPLIFNTVKSGDNTMKIESVDYSNNKTIEKFPFKFSLLFSKMKKSDITEVNLGNNNYAYENIKFPIKYYSEITDIKDDISFDIFLEDFGYIYSDNEATGTNTHLKNYTEDFTIKSYLLTEEELNEVINNNKKLDDKNLYQGTFDLIHHSGNIHIQKEKINNFISNNKNKKIYLYTSINKAYNNRNNYSFLKSKINLILPENPINNIPYDTYILGYIKGDSKKANKEKINHKYKLNLASINEENNYIKIEFTSTDEDIKFNVNNNSTIFIKKYENMDNFGKNTYIIKPEKITDDLYISIESPIKEYDNEYTFKYSLLNKYKDELILKEYPYEYQSNVTKCNISNSSISYIKFQKIKKKNSSAEKLTNCNCNYYISIYKKNNNSNNESLNNTISIKKSESPYVTYKVNNDSNDDFLEANIHVHTNDEFYYEIIGEDRDTKELFGYKKSYPMKDSNYNDNKKEENKEDDNKKKEDKSQQGFDWLLFILIVSGLLLVIIGICLCKKYWCNSKQKKYKTRKNDKINIDLKQNETLYENPLLKDRISS